MHLWQQMISPAISERVVCVSPISLLSSKRTSTLPSRTIRRRLFHDVISISCLYLMRAGSVPGFELSAICPYMRIAHRGGGGWDRDQHHRPRFDTIIHVVLPPLFCCCRFRRKEMDHGNCWKTSTAHGFAVSSRCRDR